MKKEYRITHSMKLGEFRVERKHAPTTTFPNPEWTPVDEEGYPGLGTFKSHNEARDLVNALMLQDARETAEWLPTENSCACSRSGRCYAHAIL